MLMYTKENMYFYHLSNKKGFEEEHINLSASFVPNCQSIMFFIDQTGGWKVWGGLVVTSDGGETSLDILAKKCSWPQEGPLALIKRNILKYQYFEKQ